MSDPLLRQLRNEPKPAARPFLAARIAARANDPGAVRRRKWLAVYWLTALAATAIIVARADWPGVVVQAAVALAVPVTLALTLSGGWRKLARRVASYLG